MDELEKKSRLEEIIEDFDAFKIMLDGAFRDWNGTYDVLLVDTNEYLFDSPNQTNFRPFCGKLRSNPVGNERCYLCDIAFAHKVARNPQDDSLQIYFCHVGLMDMAIPIIVDGEHIATVFCGQVRSTDPKLDTKHFEHVRRIEAELRFKKGELEKLAKETPKKSLEELEVIRKRVRHLVEYISSLGHQRNELQLALKIMQKEAYEKANRDGQRRKVYDVLNKATEVLTTLTTDWDKFWIEVSNVLEDVAGVINAQCAMVLIPTIKENSERELSIKAVSGLPYERFKSVTYPFYDPVLELVLTGKQQALITSYDNLDDVKTLSGSIKVYDAELSRSLNTVILVHIDFSNTADELKGILLFCLDKEQNAVSLDETIRPLIQLKALIEIAYYNSTIYQAQKAELIRRQNWLKQVSHQLISPLHGLQGYAENMKTWQRRWETNTHYFDYWDDEQLKRWKNAINSVIWTADYAARLARNLEWFALTDDQKRAKLVMKRIDDVGQLMIRYVRDFQGIAHNRGIRTVYVAEASFTIFNNQLCISDDLFRQAVGNLLDNAVKYSEKKTDITIEASRDSNQIVVKINNEGIQLHEEELQYIFEYEKRGKSAINRHAPGTGIGLTIALEIIKLHGGQLVASPSVRAASGGWKTTFSIILPLSSNCD